MLAIIIQGQWRPGIGDPTVMGWVTTVAYLIAAGLCGAYAKYGSRKTDDGRQSSDVGPPPSVIGLRAFWWGLAVLMLLMGLNKQLDLQVLLLSVGKQMSRVQGWYAERRAVRKWFVMSAASLGLILILWLGWTSRGVWRRYALAIFGIALLVLFVLIRASSDCVVILGHRPGRLPMCWIFEIGGIACIGASALIELRRSSKS